MEKDNKESIWLKYIPEYVNLYYVDYRDDLDNNMELLQDCLAQNDLSALHDSIWDWYPFPTEEYMKDIREAMLVDGVEDVFEECQDEIEAWLYERDISTPVEDLIGNTTFGAFFYDTGLTVPNHEYGWYEYTPGQIVNQICRKLKISGEARKKVRDIVENAWYGASVRIYFQASFMDLITSDNEDFKSISFKGKFYLGAIDTVGGSGDFEPIELDVKLPFIRENLFISSSEKYSLEHIFGMFSNWADDSAKPTLSYNKSKKKIKTGVSAAQLQYDRKCAEVYKKGGCTFGDMDINRHRDVRYENGFPAGSRCPHCGTFWID